MLFNVRLKNSFINRFAGFVDIQCMDNEKILVLKFYVFVIAKV